MPDARIYIVMGVSDSGKSTVGKLLAVTLGLPYFDGDDFHSKENVEKMSKGGALTDEDRQEWLYTLNGLAANHLGNGAVIACSALKGSYRKVLRQTIENAMVFVYLHGTFDEIHERMRNRKGHFMPSTLLKSQFETLEPPVDAITVSINARPEEIVQKIREAIE